MTNQYNPVVKGNTGQSKIGYAQSCPTELLKKLHEPDIDYTYTYSIGDNDDNECEEKSNAEMLATLAEQYDCTEELIVLLAKGKL